MSRNKQSVKIRYPLPVPATKLSGPPVQASTIPSATLEAARFLLGCCLCRELEPGLVERLPTTETEAYDGPSDRACHASKGRTARTEVMFGPAGRWYVYLCYGIHWLLNLVTGPVNEPAAVLIRSAGPHVGPGRLTRALAIDGSLNRKRASKSCGLWLELNPALPQPAIVATPRIGVDYAGPDWATRPYRFFTCLTPN